MAEFIKFSESELRDELERRGIRSHNVPSGDIERLRQMYVQGVVGVIVDHQDGSSSGVSRNGEQQSVSMSGALQQGGARVNHDDDIQFVVGTRDRLDERQMALEAEIEKKRKILQLQAELAQLNAEFANQNLHAAAAPGQQAEPRGFNQIDLDNAVNVFSGDDSFGVNMFLNDFESAAQQFGWSDCQKAIFVKRYLRGTAKALVSAVRAVSWNEIKAELVGEFGVTVTAAEVHKKLSTRTKRQEESPQQFVIAMRQIAAEGDIAETDLVNYIIAGLARDKSERLFFSSATTLNDLRALLNRFRITSNNNNIPYQQQLQQRNAYPPNIQAATRDGQMRRPMMRCYNCNEFGHISASCAVSKKTPTNPFLGARNNQHLPLQNVVVKREIANVDGPENEINYEEKVSLFLVNSHSNTTINLKALLDTGSPISFVKAKYVPSVFIEPGTAHSNFVGLNGSCMNALGEMKASIV